MKTLVLLFTLTFLLQAEFVQLPKKYDFFKARVACSERGLGWRVPEIWELFTLRGQAAKYGKDRRYWSANALGEARVIKMLRHENEYFVNSKDIPAFSFYLQDGDIGPTPKNINAHVLCTNQEKILPSDEGFVLEEEGVIDRRNKIIWAALTDKSLSHKQNLEGAITHCDNSSDEGREWRLPTLKELYTIVNYNYIKPAVNPAIFGFMKKKYYLSSTKFDSQTVYVVGFSVGSIATSNFENYSYFRCVSDLEKEEL